MKGKIIYVDFVKKQRISFFQFFVQKMIILIISKFKTRHTNSKKSSQNTRKYMSN